MPVIEVPGLGDVEFPDDMSREEMARAIKDKLNPPSSAWDFVRSIPRGMVKGFTGMAMGGDPDVVAAQVGMGQSPEDIIGEQRGVQTELPAAIAKLPLPDPRTTAGRYGQSVGEAVGNPASYVGPSGMPMKLGYAALSGTGAQTGSEVAPGSWLARPIGSLAAVLAPAAATRLISPSTIPAARQPGVAALRDRGIEPTAGDVTGSPRIRQIEEMGDLPGGGRSFTAGQEQVHRQFSRSASRLVGTDEELLSPEAIQTAERNIEARTQAATSRSVIKQDQQLGDGLVQVIQDMVEDGLPAATIDRIKAQAAHINSGFVTRTTRAGNTVGEMSGDAYYALTRDGTPLARAIKDKDPNIAYYASRLRGELDDALNRSAHGRGTRAGRGRQAAFDELEETQRQYYTMQVLRESLAPYRAAGMEGLIDPHKLRMNLTGQGSAVAAHAARKLEEMGATDLFDLAKAGNAIMQPFEKAGHLGMPTLTGVGMGLGGRVANSAPVQGLLKNQVAVPVRESLPSPGVAALRADATTERRRKLPAGWHVEQVR